MSAYLIFTTAPDKKTAQRLAKGLVGKKFAACVSVLDGASSTYRWKGKVETARECLLTVKTSAKRVKQAMSAIEASHPYEVPEVIAIPVKSGSKNYMRWIEESLGL